MQVCLNNVGKALPDAGELVCLLRPTLYKAYKPAFLGRMTVVPFFPLPDAVLERVIALKLGRVRVRLLANHRATLDWDRKVVDAVLARCDEADAGARNVD